MRDYDEECTCIVFRKKRLKMGLISSQLENSRYPGHLGEEDTQ